MRIKDAGEAVNSVQNLHVGVWFNNQPAELPLSRLAEDQQGAE